MNPASSFLWHDYETFGSDPRLDRPSEFACWRTDENFEPIDDPHAWRCQPSLDYLPDPVACAITGIGPESALKEGLPEPTFAENIYQQMAQAQTCALGYNSIRFDDEISRHLFWRNFIDPYEREWARGNSRFDLIDLTRAAYALRPQGVIWPLREDGHASFKLSDLTSANALPHSHAHAALSDVEATLGLARLLRAQQPKLMKFALDLRRKSRVLELLDWQGRTPVVHISQRFPAERGCLAIVVPLAVHPSQAGKVIVVDAFHDPEALLTWPAERLAQMLVATSDMPDRVALGVKLVHANRAPFLAPLPVLTGVDLARLRLDRPRTDTHIERLRSAPELGNKLQQIYRLLDQTERVAQDVDAALYEGFINDADRALMIRFRSATPIELATIASRFVDRRLAALAFRFRARHHEPTLSPNESKLWLKHCRSQLTNGKRSLDTYYSATEALTDAALIDDLRQWAARVSKHANFSIA